MKKIYFAPNMETIEEEAQQLLAASLPLNDTETVTDSKDILAPEMDASDYDF